MTGIVPIFSPGENAPKLLIGSTYSPNIPIVVLPEQHRGRGAASRALCTTAANALRTCAICPDIVLFQNRVDGRFTDGTTLDQEGGVVLGAIHCPNATAENCLLVKPQ